MKIYSSQSFSVPNTNPCQAILTAISYKGNNSSYKDYRLNIEGQFYILKILELRSNYYDPPD